MVSEVSKPCGLSSFSPCYHCFSCWWIKIVSIFKLLNSTCSSLKNWLVISSKTQRSIASFDIHNPTFWTKIVFSWNNHFTLSCKSLHNRRSLKLLNAFFLVFRSYSSTPIPHKVTYPVQIDVALLWCGSQHLFLKHVISKSRKWNREKHNRLKTPSWADIFVAAKTTQGLFCGSANTRVFSSHQIGLLPMKLSLV